MKIIRISIISILIAASLNITAQIKVNSNGKVGLIGNPSSTHDVKINGTTELVNEVKIIDSNGDEPSLEIGGDNGYVPNVLIDASSYYGYELYVSGEVYSTIGFQSSDYIFKKDINDIGGPELLSKLMKIKGRKYQFKTKEELANAYSAKNDSSRIKMPIFPRGEYYGLIAQEVETEFPELVRLDSLTKTKAINYDGMIPILLEAIKEQQIQINELTNCCQGNLKSGSMNNAEEFNLDKSSAKLYQNTPNPFSTQTTIRYEIPETVQSAQLHICNMTGTLLKTIEINQKGAGDEIISANEFKAGMYLYSLVCDGKIVDTKQMLLTE